MRLNGSVDPNGANVTVWLDIGTTTTYEFPSAVQNFGLNPVNFSQLLIGLTAGTTYHYRVVATNDTGTSRGMDRTLRTRNGR